MPQDTTSIVVSEPSSFVTIAKPSAMTDAQLVEAIASHHQAAELAANTAVDRAMAAGDVLIEAKSRCQHGEWGGWLAEHFAGSDRTAQSYMRLARSRGDIEGKSAGSADLSIDAAITVLAQPKLTSLSPAEREELDRHERTIRGRPRIQSSSDRGLASPDEDPLAFNGVPVGQPRASGDFSDPNLPDIRTGSAFLGFCPEGEHCRRTMAQVWPSEKHPGAVYVHVLDTVDDCLVFTKRPIYADHQLLRQAIFDTTSPHVSAGWTWTEISEPFFPAPDCAFKSFAAGVSA